MTERGKITIIILISIIIILCCIVAYGVYTGFKVKAEIIRLNSENENLSLQLKSIQKDYGLLVDDVAKIYKGCIKENACKGHYPEVRWYCNNVGDRADVNPSHICVCDASCDLKLTPL